MKKMLTNNLGLKILAVLFSIILWLIVVNINDPVISVSFYGIPVEIINADSIVSQGKMYEILDGTDSIDVVVKANRSVADSLSKDNIKAVADMEQLTFMDTVGIQLSSNKYNDKLDSITSSTDSLKVNIENMRKNQLVVSCETVGEPETGYMLGNITTDQNLVRLSGPESAISKVSKAVASVNVAGMTSDISTAVELKLYDEDGNQIDNKKITTNISSVNVNVEILAKATVPLAYETVGTPAAGYAITGQITGTPGTVAIAGKKSVIDTISEIGIGDLNVTGQSSDMTTMINIKDYLPEGVRYIGTSSDVNVTIVVGIEKQTTKTLNIPSKNIIVTNVPAGIKGTLGELDDTVNIDITGLSSVIDTVNELAVQGNINLTALQQSMGTESLDAGKYNVDVDFVLPEGIVVSKPFNVEVEIAKIKVDADNTNSTGNTNTTNSAENTVSGNAQ
ncbi:MAG: CdaR family protein [Lachnospiraceae bacterium]|nr:CdaR family protein [Lachnospiraceae bacterium]